MEERTAIAYCRVSDPRQVKRKLRKEPAVERDSLDRQEAKAKTFAEANGWPLLKVFLEEGESAKTGDRTKLWEMHSWCKRNRGNVHVLIIPKIDRFARNMDDYRDLKRMFQNLGVRIASVDEHIEDTPEGRLQENVLASFAQFDNERRAERCKDGMVDAVAAGRWVWKAPYGYRNVKLADSKPNIAPFTPEADLVRHAFELVASGTTLPATAHRLLIREGMTLSKSHFFDLLRSTVYAGIIRSFGMEAKGTFEPLVSHDTFWRAQAAMMENGASQRIPHASEREDFPLRGTVRCECGRLMTSYWSRGRHGGRFGYYRCMNCARMNVNKVRVEGEFTELLRRHACPPGLLERISRRIVEKWNAVNAHELEERRKRFEERDRLRELQKALALKAAEGTIPDDLAREQIDELRCRAAVLGSDLAASDGPEHDLPRLLGAARGFLVDPAGFWKEVGLQTKKMLQDFLLKDGVTYVRNEGFLTPHLRLLEPLSTMGEESSLDWWTTAPDFLTLCQDISKLGKELDQCSLTTETAHQLVDFGQRVISHDCPDNVSLLVPNSTSAG